MKRHNEVVKELSLAGMRQLESSDSRSKLISLALIIFLALATLACAFLGSNSHPASRSIVIRNRLPTLTPTPRPEFEPAPAVPPQVAEVTAVAVVEPEIPPQPTTAAGAAAPNSSPTLNQNAQAANPPAVEAPVPPAGGTDPTLLSTPSSADFPTATPPPRATTVAVIPDIKSGDWSFTGVRLYTGQDEDGGLLYGDLVNNTGAAQHLNFITGNFYNAQGHVIAGTEISDAYWPIEVIPAGGSLPFELTVEGVLDTANFDLGVEAEPSAQNPHQDFELFDLKQSNEAGKYCITGQIQNLGEAVQEYLVIAVILYDSNRNIVNFSPFQEPGFENLVGDQTLDVDVCIGVSDQNIAGYDMRAWGQ